MAKSAMHSMRLPKTARFDVLFDENTQNLYTDRQDLSASLMPTKGGSASDGRWRRRRAPHHLADVLGRRPKQTPHSQTKEDVMSFSFGAGSSKRIAVLGFAIATALCAISPTALARAAAPAGVVTADPAKEVNPATAPVRNGAPLRGFVNRPTVPLDQYRAAKTRSGGGRRQGASTEAPSAPLAITNLGGFNGITQATAGGVPPDINGAVSSTQIATVVNSHLTVFSKSTTPSVLADNSFATLTGYTAQGLFDPRILYDKLWKRWVISFEAFPESASVQAQFLLISTTSSATGSYIVYNVNATQLCGSGNFWDYPQIGLQQDAVVLTGNCFQGNTYLGSKAIGIAKAILYNGAGFSVPNQGPFDNTLTPTNVIDQNPRMHMLTRSVHNVTFNNPGNGFYGGVTGNVAIGGFFTPSTPRAAGQAGCATTSCKLDTGDGRFVAPGTQYGDNVWNVATYGASGNGTFATPSWGQFDVEGTGANTTKQAGQTFVDACSDDFNASLVAQTNNSMWINYNSTDPQGSSCGQTFVRQIIGGRLSGTASGQLTSISNVFTSAAQLTGNFDSNFGLQRWGDTSSVSSDPSAPATIAWTWNESVVNSNTWGTRAQKVKNQ
jgi:hypothetical protein